VTKVWSKIEQSLYSKVHKAKSFGNLVEETDDWPKTRVASAMRASSIALCRTYIVRPRGRPNEIRQTLGQADFSEEIAVCAPKQEFDASM